MMGWGKFKKQKNMKTLIRCLLLVLIAGSFSFTANAQKQKKKKADEETAEWRYEIACEKVGSQGTYLVKVWSYSRKPEVAVEQAKKNAVHGVIFKGFSGNGCATQKPIARSASLEAEKADFFKLFFASGGKYMKFVTSSNNGSVAAGDVTKVGKKEYKVGVVVTVQKDLLRKDLEAAGIIKGLSSGF